MNLTRDRARSIGWAVVLTICLALTFRVNAVKSQVRLTERQIVALRQERLFLETEFETRASQQQLRNLNEVEFGYEAPRAEQYLEGERQLAVLGKDRAPGAPAPIRVAMAAGTDEAALLPSMVSPLTGKALAAEIGDNGQASEGGGERGDHSAKAATLAYRLARIDGAGKAPRAALRE